MLIAKIQGDEVLEVADYQTIFPNTSFTVAGPNDEFLAENSCMPVAVWLPYDSRTQKLVSAAPYIQNGYVYTVAVEQKTQEELDADTAVKAAQVRAERDRKLAESDWTQGKDIPDSISAPWAVYRQELRDITKQAGFPWEVVWPQEP